MTLLQQVLAALERLAPAAQAAPWDNVGLLVENEGPITGALTTLDITPATVREAQALGCNLIVAHHPVIFTPLRALAHDSVPALLARANVAAVCLHTNLDAAEGGTGDTLAQLLGLGRVRRFDADGLAGLGRVGSLPAPMDMAALAAHCRQVLGAPVRYVPCGRMVRQVAVVTGAGDVVQEALAAGADALITGEVRYHHAQQAAALGLGLVEAGHYATEAPIAQRLAQYLQAAFPQLPVHVSAVMQDVFCTLPQDV